MPHGFALASGDALAFARLGVLEATLFGSTTLVDAYFHPREVAQAALETGVDAHSAAATATRAQRRCS